VACIFSTLRKADLFLRGIQLDLLRGASCPSRQCKFIDYEDLPVYSIACETGITIGGSLIKLADILPDKLPVYSDTDQVVQGVKHLYSM